MSNSRAHKNERKPLGPASLGDTMAQMRQSLVSAIEGSAGAMKVEDKVAGAVGQAASKWDSRFARADKKAKK